MLKSAREEYERARPFETDMRKFCEFVENDTALQEKLKKAVENNIDYNGFKDLYVSIAASHDCQFTAEQMDVAVQEQKHGKNRILPIMVQKLVLEISDYPH